MYFYSYIPPRTKNIIGKKFNSLLVIGFAGFYQSATQRISRWFCLCDCRRIKPILSSSLRSGNSSTCGCRGQQRGQSTLRYLYPHEYNVFLVMWQRCTNKNSCGFKWYGAQGISVAPVWKSFDRFITDVGPKPGPGYSLDRYPNRLGNYEPGNVRWATQAEQLRNTSRNIKITYNGQTHCLTDWSQISGISKGTITYRYNHNCSTEELFLKSKLCLTDVERKDIYSRYMNGNVTQKQLANEYGMDQSSISSVIKKLRDR